MGWQGLGRNEQGVELKVSIEHRTTYALTRVAGSVREAEAYGVDVYVAGTDDLIASNATVTIRQATGIPGWVGMIDLDLTAYADVQLELRQPRATCDCGALFTVSGGLPDRSLIRGTRQHLAPLDDCDASGTDQPDRLPSSGGPGVISPGSSTRIPSAPGPAGREPVG